MPHNIDKIKVLLVGTGYMAKEYAKILKSLHIDFHVIGRSSVGCNKFSEEFPGIKVSSGGVETHNISNDGYTHAIIASNIESLMANSISLLQQGIKFILLEKPGGKNKEEINQLADAAAEANANVVLAYNRRFYSSVLKAKKIIEQDGGVSSFNFEFTEWAHTIEPLQMDSNVKENWFLANSTHVVDTAFFLAGKPDKLCAYYGGGLSWHKASSCFAGAGVSKKGAFFSYHADWKAPGRWVIEILTLKNRLIFKPLETLQIQAIASVAVNPVELEDRLDKDFKPGVYLQTKFFLQNKLSCFCDIQEQRESANSFYSEMAGY